MVIDAHYMKLILGYLNDEIAEECNALGRAPRQAARRYIMRLLTCAPAVSKRANYRGRGVTAPRFPLSCRVARAPRYLNPFNLAFPTISALTHADVRTGLHDGGGLRGWSDDYYRRRLVPRKRPADICIRSPSRCNAHKYRVIHLNVAGAQ